ncbi:MAG: thioredoxin family protein [Anaerolineales bacterium]
MQVQLLYTDDCEHRPQAWSALNQAMQRSGVRAYVDEIRVRDLEQARQLGFAGSPTILINGRDIAPGGPPTLECRSYPAEDGQSRGWPDVATLVWALEAAEEAIGCCG